MKHLSLLIGSLLLILVSILLSVSKKYNILPLNIVLYLLCIIGVLFVGFNLGKISGEKSKSKSTHK
jgi:VIT1/CCC1 family predicted Fe2+/Mn2+ transporter